MTDPTYATDGEPSEQRDDHDTDEERPAGAESAALGGAGFGVVGPEDVDDDPAADPRAGDVI